MQKFTRIVIEVFIYDSTILAALYEIWNHVGPPALVHLVTAMATKRPVVIPF